MIWWKPLCSVIRYGGPFHWNGESPVCRQMICNVSNALLPFASSGSLTMFCSLEIYPMDLEETHGCYPLLQWKSAPHWSSCRRAPRRWSKCLEFEQVPPLSPSLTYTSGHDHKTLITLVLDNFHSCQLWPSLVESTSFLIISDCCVQPPYPPTQAASWSCPATLRCRGATECRCIGEFHVGREPYTAWTRE